MAFTPLPADPRLSATLARRSATFATMVLVALGGCATVPSAGQKGAEGGASAPPIPAHAEPPPPPVNLSGFPLTYRQGHADGCASAAGPERKDGARFAADGNYRTGWQDGLALCRKR